MVAIIDYDAGNIRSVEKEVRYLGKEVTVTSEPEEILAADRVILPPFLGICLGLQLLFEKSEESPGVPGLGLLQGEILRLPELPGLKVPHIGWNSLKYPNPGRLFRGIPEDSYVYFVHSYYLKAQDEGIVTATTEYGTLVHASVESGNLFACQFHPEKSSETGLTILENFLSI